MKRRIGMQQGLLLIDIQNDYFNGGAMELMGMSAAADRAAQLLKSWRKRTAPVYLVQHLAMNPGATFFLPGTAGAEIHATVAPMSGEPVIIKHFPNSFRETGLLEILRKDGVDQLIIAGAMSHMCIDATTRAAFDLGFHCLVVEDACATRDLEFKGEKIKAQEVHGAFMAALKTLYAEVISTGDLKLA
jgi:nicotinamidase-related amidase